MKTAILYGSRVKLTSAHRRVNSRGSHPDYFVRMRVVNMDLVDALYKAKPMIGEVVLNSVELDGGSK